MKKGRVAVVLLARILRVDILADAVQDLRGRLVAMESIDRFAMLQSALEFGKLWNRLRVAWRLE